MHGLCYLICCLWMNESTHFYTGTFIFMFMWMRNASRNERRVGFNEMKNLNESTNRTLHRKRANGLICIPCNVKAAIEGSCDKQGVSYIKEQSVEENEECKVFYRIRNMIRKENLKQILKNIKMLFFQYTTMKSLLYKSIKWSFKVY